MNGCMEMQIREPFSKTNLIENDFPPDKQRPSFHEKSSKVVNTEGLIISNKGNITLHAQDE